MRWKKDGLVEIVVLESGIRTTGEKMVSEESGEVVYMLFLDGMYWWLPKGKAMEVVEMRDILIGLIL